MTDTSNNTANPVTSSTSSASSTALSAGESSSDFVVQDPSRVLNINVGVLGHVDSGKTSLVKTLSTLLSTACLDKSPESRKRGITLDLGFSAFLMPLPPTLATQSDLADKYDLVQVTLVDCPGHASLIRTIIGGAQIIDMILLVIDATKGIQTQTAECLVIAEITTSTLIIVLNKVDLLPSNHRDEAIQTVQKKIYSTLKYTRFAQAPMVPVSACVGGGGDLSDDANAQNQTYGIPQLVQLLNSYMHPPDRSNIHSHAFYFAIDHCFPIKGQGTVITGTCLAGSIKVNDTLEFPTLALQRKIKSMQMFHRKVKEIKQGDRAGICLSNLDSTLLERGIAAFPNSVQVMDSAIALIQQVRYFKGSLTSKSKFHISVGHATVMATVTFFGAREIAQKQQQAHDTNNKDLETFDFEQSYIQQDEYIHCLEEEEEENESESTVPRVSLNKEESSSFHSKKKAFPLHYAILEFQTPVFCPLKSLIIGSKLDTDIQANSCRLAFSGRFIEKLDKDPSTQIKMYTKKEKCGLISRLGDPFRLDDGTIVRFEIYGSELFKKETDMNLFIGLKVETTTQGEIGVIQSSYGTSGQFKVFFPAGTTAKEGDKLILGYKRFLHDAKKTMHQDIVIPSPRLGTRIIQDVVDNGMKKNRVKKTEKKSIPSAKVASLVAISGKEIPSRNKTSHLSAIPQGPIALNSSLTEPATSTLLSTYSRMSISGVNKPDTTTAVDNPSTNISSFTEQKSKSNILQEVIIGEICTIKEDMLVNGLPIVVIVSGLFTPEIDIREYVGSKVQVVGSAQEEGKIIGSFGKAGKCKVSFPLGISCPLGTKVQRKQLK